MRPTLFQTSSVQTKTCQTAIQALCVLLLSVLCYMGNMRQVLKISNHLLPSDQTYMDQRGLQCHVLQSHRMSFRSPDLIIFVLLMMKDPCMLWYHPMVVCAYHKKAVGMCFPFQCTVCVCGVSVWLSAAVVYSAGQGVSSHWLVNVLRSVVRKFLSSRCLGVKTEADGNADC